MLRRRFLTTAAVSGAWLLGRNPGNADEPAGPLRTFETPEAARASAPEDLAYVVATHAGTKINKPDYLATIDLDPRSKSFGQVIHRLGMPNVGDELHHFGWNACGSCHGKQARRFLIVPGLVSSRIHIIDTIDPRAPKLTKVIEPAAIIAKTGLTAPHTVHCLPDGHVMISMLGDKHGEGPGGFLLLDSDFEIAGRWEAGTKGMHYNYDFWYQPRHNVMISSEWAAPNTTRPGFRPDDVKAGKYGQHLHFWDWNERAILQSIDLGDSGRIPLEVRFHHNPASTHGFVGAALSSVIWHWFQDGERWRAEKVIEVPTEDVPGVDFPVPGLITDLVLSLDDRWLYFSNWLHGDVRQYDVSDPAKPRLAGRIWLGGLTGKPSAARGKSLTGGPQMLQLSLDGRRLYVTNSLFSSWDNQFYPQIAERGSFLTAIDCDPVKGGMALNDRLHVDFGAEPEGPVRAHEMRFPNGDSTSDIWF